MSRALGAFTGSAAGTTAMVPGALQGATATKATVPRIAVASPAPVAARRRRCREAVRSIASAMAAMAFSGGADR
jgi:hypothetical protein